MFFFVFAALAACNLTIEKTTGGFWLWCLDDRLVNSARTGKAGECDRLCLQRARIFQFTPHHSCKLETPVRQAFKTPKQRRKCHLPENKTRIQAENS
jgi:hypothetical protein